jgi:hypothetical protein
MNQTNTNLWRKPSLPIAVNLGASSSIWKTEEPKDRRFRARQIFKPKPVSASFSVIHGHGSYKLRFFLCADAWQTNFCIHFCHRLLSTKAFNPATWACPE